jgi:hypothetical protein
VSTGIYKKPIGVEVVDTRKTDFLFFHKAEDIGRTSCILHCKVSKSILLIAFVSFNAMDIPMRFVFIVHIV